MQNKPDAPRVGPTTEELMHYLRNATTAARGFLELLADRIEIESTPDEVHQLFSRFRADLTSLDSIVDTYHAHAERELQ